MTCARCGFAGCAASEPEALRDLFARAGRRAGAHRASSVACPGVRPEPRRRLVPARVRLPVQSGPCARSSRAEPVDFAGVDPRRRRRTTWTALAGFDELLWDHQGEPPSFSELTAPPREEIVEEWSDALGRPEKYVPVRARSATAASSGTCSLYRRPDGDLRVPDANIDLAHAATLDEVRGNGRRPAR